MINQVFSRRFSTNVQVKQVANPAAENLRKLLSSGEILRTPCCHDALSARLIQRSGFKAAFMSGFGVACARGLPDAGLVSFEESKQVTTAILDAVSNPNELFPDNQHFPIIVDADTGYGNEVNARRTVSTLARLGAAGVMIEDQHQPKRCGHARGKSVVPFEEAVSRVRAACEARTDLGRDIVIIARTDARASFGLEEALRRARAFRQVGADMTFVEAPLSVEELKEIGRDEKSGPNRMANMLLFGKTPLLTAEELHKIGFTLAAYPFDLLTASIRAMEQALVDLKQEKRSITKSQVDTLWDVAGFNRYYQIEQRYASSTNNNK